MFREPQCPTLSELLAMDQDNQAFLYHLYWHLLGREPDPQGVSTYLHRLPKVGRLFILGVILCSDESRHHLGAGELQLPAGARRLMRIRPLLDKGRAGRLLLAPVVLVCRLWEWRRRDKLILEARCLRAEARLDWQDERLQGLLTDVDAQLSQLELLLVKQRSSAAAVQYLRGRMRRIMQHGLLAEVAQAEPSIINEFDGRGEQQQRLLDALEARWEARP
ncbi:MAG: DUF4214 domain-containing protein [Pseudomonadota bacterium]